MCDGTPNGYSIITFDGNKYKQEYKAAGRSKDYQMQISVPDELATAKAAKTSVVANVFNGSARSIVRMRIDQHDWIEMKQERLPDPALSRAWQIDETLKKKPWHSLSRPLPSTHIWTALLPGDMKPGCHRIEVETVDIFGKKSIGYRLISVVGSNAKTRGRPGSGR
jgi:hypothetical protein